MRGHRDARARVGDQRVAQSAGEGVRVHWRRVSPHVEAALAAHPAYVASVYQRFDNQNASVAILVALYLRRVTHWWDDFSRDDPVPSSHTSLREALVQVGRAAWRQSEDLRYVMQPAYLQSRLHPDLLDEHWRHREEVAVSGFRSLLQGHADEIRHSDLARAASMTAYFFNLMFLGRLLHPEGMSGWNLPTDADEFAEELADFVCGYLGVACVPGASDRRNR